MMRVAQWAGMVALFGAGEVRAEDDVFPRPAELEGSIGFWKSVFVSYPGDRILLHDREHMEVVWRVIKLPTDKDGNVDYQTRTRVVKRELEAMRVRLKRLGADPTAKDAEDEVLIRLAGGCDSPILKQAHLRLRAQRGVSQNFALGRERAKKWLPKMMTILQAEGVPPEIAALPFVESNFNPRARSSAGAAGLWQLMPATARDLGLTVNATRDDRLDVIKSTRAAARMLHNNHRMLGNWPLAITGYNHGPYGVKRAVKQVGSSDLMVLIEGYRKSTWGFASKNFYAEFLAILEVLRNDDELAVLALLRDPEPEQATVQ